MAADLAYYYIVCGIVMDPALGLRVVRGRDWERGDEDGGEGFVGTVVGVGESAVEVTVQWDMRQRCRYRCGKDNKFDIRVLDSGPISSNFIIPIVLLSDFSYLYFYRDSGIRYRVCVVSGGGSGGVCLEMHTLS